MWLGEVVSSYPAMVGRGHCISSRVKEEVVVDYLISLEVEEEVAPWLAEVAHASAMAVA